MFGKLRELPFMLALPKDANIYAAKYELYLPDKKLLQKKLEQWLAEE